MEELFLLNGIEPSKKNAEEIRNEISERVISGEICPIKVNASIKFFEKVFEGDSGKNNGLSQIIRPYVVSEIEKDRHKTEYYGFKVGISETGARYNFDNCNHDELNELYEQQKQIKEKIAVIEKFLKGFQPGSHQMIIDEDTGNMSKVFAPVKISTTSPIFTLK